MKMYLALLCCFIAMVATEVLSAAEKNLLPPINKADSWRLEQHEGGKGSMLIEGETVVFTVSEIDGTEWHVQAVQTNLDLAEGKEYTLRFQIKASADRSVGLTANIDQDDWHAIGLAEMVTVGKEFVNYEYTFRAEGVVAKKNRISFMLGEAKGTVTLKNLSLTAK